MQNGTHRLPRDEHLVGADADLRAAIVRIQRDFSENGYRRVARELRAGPNRANHKRVQRLMQAMLRLRWPAVTNGWLRRRTRYPDREIPISERSSSRLDRINF